MDPAGAGSIKGVGGWVIKFIVSNLPMLLLSIVEEEKSGALLDRSSKSQYRIIDGS
jgi:hypothetical protein